MKGLKDHEAAAQEAREEAGVEGKIQKQSLGSYLYRKRRAERFDLCSVSVYLLEVGELAQWREKDERDAHWFKVDDAAMVVTEAGHSNIISSLRTVEPPSLAGGPRAPSRRRSGRSCAKAARSPRDLDGLL